MQLTKDGQRKKSCRYVTRINNDSILTEMTTLEEKTIESKRKEINDLAKRYSINNSSIGGFFKFYILNKKLEVGTVTKSIDYLSYILKNIHGYTHEEVSEFLNKNSSILKSSYADFRARIAIFNHFGMLDDVIFKGYYYLGFQFTEAHFGTRTLYAVIIKRKINNLDDLEEAVNMTAEKDILKLQQEYPLSDNMLHKMDEELQNKIKEAKKEAFMKEFERRKLNRKLKNDN